MASQVGERDRMTDGVSNRNKVKTQSLAGQFIPDSITEIGPLVGAHLLSLASRALTRNQPNRREFHLCQKESDAQRWQVGL